MDQQNDKTNAHSDKNEQVQALEDKIIELENNWKRALADYKNLEIRLNEEKSKVTEFANFVLVEQLVSVLDNFEMLEKHISDQGLHLSIRNYRNILENNGLKEFEISEGMEFDHASMDALETVDGEKNKVVEVVRKGYMFKNKLIRPASVKVGSGTAEKMEEQS